MGRGRRSTTNSQRYIFSGLPLTSNKRKIYSKKMPAGVSWPTYLKFFVAAGLSMFAGSHTVHTFYRPLDDMEAWFQKFEAEERRQRMIIEAMQEQKSSQNSKLIDKESSGKDDKS